MSESKTITFQALVSEVLIRHRSILDVMTKLQESNSKVSRAVAKSVTNCGCLAISAGRQDLPPDTDFLSWKNHMESHLTGDLCPRCQEIVETELGQTFFYLAALCSLLHLDIEEILEKEKARISTLGLFNLT